MPYDPDIHHRRSIRLADYDYSQAGAYFVTIVCKDRGLLMENPEFKDIVEESWLWLAQKYEHVSLLEYVVMPNHFHGVVIIGDSLLDESVGYMGRGGSRTAPTKPLGRLIGAFKTISTKRINQIRGSQGLGVWQRNYYERVVRNEEELISVRQYIIENPANWEEDPENPAIAIRRGRDHSPVVGAVREPPLRSR